NELHQLDEVEQVAVEQSQEQFLAQRLTAQRLREERNEVIQPGRNHPRREYEAHEPDRVFHRPPPGAACSATSAAVSIGIWSASALEHPALRRIVHEAHPSIGRWSASS